MLRRLPSLIELNATAPFLQLVLFRWPYSFVCSSPPYDLANSGHNADALGEAAGRDHHAHTVHSTSAVASAPNLHAVPFPQRDPMEIPTATSAQLISISRTSRDASISIRSLQRDDRMSGRAPRVRFFDTRDTSSMCMSSSRLKLACVQAQS